MQVTMTPYGAIDIRFDDRYRKTHAESGIAYFAPVDPTEDELVKAALGSADVEAYLDDAYAKHGRTDEAIRDLMRAAITGESNATLSHIKERIADQAREKL